MILFKVESGETWTIVANNRHEAAALYVEDVLKACDDWPEEKPEITALDPSQPYTLTLDSGTQVKLSGHEWLSLLRCPQVLGCSLI